MSAALFMISSQTILENFNIFEKRRYSASVRSIQSSIRLNAVEISKIIINKNRFRSVFNKILQFFGNS